VVLRSLLGLERNLGEFKEGSLDVPFQPQDGNDEFLYSVTSFLSKINKGCLRCERRPSILVCFSFFLFSLVLGCPQPLVKIPR
jgi:hypothetical protein